MEERKRKRAVGTAFLVGVFLALGCGCGGGAPVEERADLKMSQKEIVLSVGEREKISAWLEGGPNEYVQIEWYSLDTAIATVEEGVVVARAEGETAIVAQTKENTASCKVTVLKKQEAENATS